MIPRRFWKARDGSVVTVFALSSMALAVLTAIVMTQVTLYLEKRRLQGAVDMAVLMMMQSGAISDDHAKILVAEQIGDDRVEVAVVRGRYVPDMAVAPGQRFTADATPHNALRLDAHLPGDKVMMASMLPELTVRASARAARRQTASFAVGSRLVRFEGGLSAALLDATLGYDGKLTVMDYNSLAAARVDAVEFLQALNIEADIEAVTFDDVLDSNVKLGEVLDALAATTPDGDIEAMLDLAEPPPGAGSFKLSSVMSLGSVGGLPLDALTTGGAFPLSVGEVLAGSAALANDDQQIAVDLGAMIGEAALANVTLDVGEKPRIIHYDAWSEVSDTASTTQLKLNIGALGLLKVNVSLAGAEVVVDDISCVEGGAAQVRLNAVTEAASVELKAPILPKITVKLGSGEEKALTFSPDDIANQTWKPVRSGLGLKLGSLSIAQKALFNPVDALLEKLGLHVAEADVKVMAASCGKAGLVH